jgi:hypothetical protein
MTTKIHSIFPIIIVLIICITCGCINSEPSSGGNNTTPTPTFTILPTITSSYIPVNASPTSITPYSDRAVQCPKENNGSFAILNGQPFSYHGFADRESISMIRYWIFGNTYASFGTVPIQQDKSFNFTLNGEQTLAMINGTYRILFEYPSSDGTYDIKIGSTGKRNDKILYDRAGNRIINFQDVMNNYLPGTDAANIVEKEIRKSSPEGVINLTLVMQKPGITISPVSVHDIGDIITFNGTTNLPPGEIISLEIVSANIISCPKNPFCDEDDSVRPCCGGMSQEVAVKPAGCGITSWSWEVNTSQHQFYPGTFVLYAEDPNLFTSKILFFEMRGKANT